MQYILRHNGTYSAYCFDLYNLPSVVKKTSVRLKRQTLD
jgi:hypothetical protein